MARLWQSGFELNSTTASVELNSITSATISSATKRSGSYSLRINPSASIQKAFYQFSAAGTNVTFYRVYINIASLPTAQTKVFFLSNDLDALFGIRLNTDGSLALYEESGGTQKGSNSSVLSTNTWYRIELKIDATTISADAGTALLDGSQFATGTANHTSIGKAIYFNLGDTVNSTVDFYVDDIAINDNSGSFQNSYPGSGKIIHLKPSAAGDSNGFLAQVGGTAGSTNNFTRVNEIPPDDSTSYNGAALLNAEDLFNADDSGIGSGDTVNVVALGVRMADLAGADATAAFKVEIEKTSGGTKSQSATIIPNSTSWVSNASAAPRNHPLITYQDPDSINWTQTTLDSMQIGYIQIATNVQTIAISNVYASVDYTSAAVPPTTTVSTTMMMGVG